MRSSLIFFALSFYCLFLVSSDPEDDDDPEDPDSEAEPDDDDPEELPEEDQEGEEELDLAVLFFPTWFLEGETFLAT